MNYYFLIVSLFCLYFTGCNKSSELSQTEQSSANESEIASKDVDIVWGEDGNSVLLKTNWIPGKEYNFRQVTDMKMDLPLAGAEGSKTEMSIDFKIDVQSLDDSSNKKIQLGFDKVKMTMQMAGQNMVYDSEDPDNQSPLLKTTLSSLSDQTYEATFDENNKILSLEGEGEAAGNGLGMGAMSQGDVENMLQQLGDFKFPEAMIDPDTKWQNKQNFKMQQIGEMNMTVDYTYQGPVESDGKKLAKITFSGKAETSGEGLVSFKDSKMTGTMLFDPKLGALLESETKMDMTMSIGGEAGAEMDTATISKYRLISVD